jgi:AhpD family alkylhydroperoxidase
MILAWNCTLQPVTRGSKFMVMTNTSTPRINFAKAAPQVFKALIGFDAAAREGLDPALVELVQIRSSQLNGCAYCLHMHTSDARKAGESEERLHMVAISTGKVPGTDERVAR